MILELSATEHQMLVEILNERLNSLRVEIQHTDLRSFKAMLLERERTLEKLRDRMVTRAAA